MKQQKIKKVFKNSAGIDIGSEKNFIGIEGKEVKSFNTFTEGHLKAIEYLKGNNISTVAMEATGVYWFSFYELLEESGIEVYLVNGRDTKNVPGRKSDVADCQWLQQLHSYGLLRKCFIPDDITRQLRTYTRLRRDHIALSSQHVLHMQKAFNLMNIKLHNVISDIKGVSGMRIIKALISGIHNPEELVLLCDKSILKVKRNEIIASLKGNIKEEYIFSLKQAVEAYEFYQRKIDECDKKIEQLLEFINQDKEEIPAITKAKHSNSRNSLQIDNLHEHLMKLTGGKDPSQITGLSDKTLMELIAETGVDLTKWKTAKHFTSWLCLSPGKNQSGKSNRRGKSYKAHSKAGQIFRNCANSISGSKHTALKGFYNRIKSRRGPMIAMKATARKLAVLYYNIMVYGVAYVEQGLEMYESKYKEQQIKRLQKQAKKLGLQLSAL